MKNEDETWSFLGELWRKPSSHEVGSKIASEYLREVTPVETIRIYYVSLYDEVQYGLCHCINKLQKLGEITQEIADSMLEKLYDYENKNGNLMSSVKLRQVIANREKTPTHRRVPIGFLWSFDYEGSQKRATFCEEQVCQEENGKSLQPTNKSSN